MNHRDLLKLIKKEMTAEDIANQANLSLAKVRIFLFRLQEEGKVNRTKKGDKWYWSKTEDEDKDFKLKKYRQQS